MNALDVDEVVGQLLASKCSARSRNSRSWTPPRWPRSRGSTRTRGGRDPERAKCRNTSPASRRNRTPAVGELGVADELKEVDGVTTRMLVAFGENDIKTVEDLAGCATDDLVGWTEGRARGHPPQGRARRLRHLPPGRREHDHRRPVKAGWIEALVETEETPRRPRPKLADLERRAERRARRAGDGRPEKGPGGTEEARPGRPRRGLSCRGTGRSAPASSAARRSRRRR